MRKNVFQGYCFRFVAIILLTLFYNYQSDAQSGSTLTLEYCQQQARENYPLLKQKTMLQQTSDLTIENISKAYLPTFEFNAQASYQSAVVEIPFQLPGQEIPEFPKDHYQFTLDVKETIYDGGTAREQKKIQEAGLLADQQKVEVELFKLRQQVNLVYFAVLLGDKTIEQLNLTKEDLQKKYDQVNVTVKNGASLKSNAEQIEAELLKNQQRITEAFSVKVSYVKSLGLLINQPLDPATIKLQTPVLVSELPAYAINTRPDLVLLQHQQLNLEAMKGLTKTKTTPKAGAFAQLGYGRPGLDPFSTQFEPYYLAGLKVSWNIWNWNASSNERQIYTIQQDMLNRQIEALDINVKLQSIQQTEEIQKLQTLIEQDKQLITLRKNISKTASNQVDNGVITVTDYLTQVNAQYLAELSLTTHELQLIYAQVNYVTTLGK
ncbi:MAG TPA: TolC family protein [Chitinophagales bacterium]|nr:TolC family protein [Chitinophagales bacterium]